MNEPSSIWNMLGGAAMRERMLAVALRCGAASREEGEDCVQDALVSMVRSPTSLEGLRSVDAWVTQCVVNATRMRLRASGRARRGGKSKLVEFFDEAYEPDDELSNVERRLVLRECLTHVEAAITRDRDADLLEAYLRWDGTMKSFAERRGEKFYSLKTRLRRLRLRLKAVLDAA